MFSRRINCIDIDRLRRSTDERQQAEVARLLHRRLELPLELRAVAGPLPREELPLLGAEALERVQVLVGDLERRAGQRVVLPEVRVLLREAARAAIDELLVTALPCTGERDA